MLNNIGQTFFFSRVGQNWEFGQVVLYDFSSRSRRHDSCFRFTHFILFWSTSLSLKPPPIVLYQLLFLFVPPCQLIVDCTSLLLLTICSFPLTFCFFSSYTHKAITMKLAVSLLLVTLAVVVATVKADPDLLQDICVADLTSGMYSL